MKYKSEAGRVYPGWYVQVPGVRGFHRVIEVHPHTYTVTLVFEPPHGDVETLPEAPGWRMADPRTLPDETVTLAKTYPIMRDDSRGPTVPRP